MDKFLFMGDCFSFRSRETPAESSENEALWQEMMKNKSPIEDSVFLSLCDMSGMLDEDESPQEYLSDAKRSDSESCAYKSKMGDTVCYFYYTAGFEFIFTENGEPPAPVKEKRPTSSKRKKRGKVSP
jgi:hypothetical protein